jgi:hypothetical protein
MPPLRMPHHAMLCSSCLNCQFNFRLKVFLLFLTPTAVSFFFYSFFCFSHASVLPDFLNWLFTVPPLHMPPHATLCSSSRVPAVVFQHSCSSSRVPAVVYQHSCSSSRVPAFVFQQSCSSSRVPSFVILHWCFSIYVSAFVIQHLCFSIYVSAFVIQHLCFSIYVRIGVAASVFVFVLQQFALVLQHLCSHTFVLQRLCFSFGVPASVLHKQSIAINDNLDHLRHLCCSHISNNLPLWH